MRSPHTVMRGSPLRRATQIAWELSGVLPRSVGALHASGDWRRFTPTGWRQLGEVALDLGELTGEPLHVGVQLLPHLGELRGGPRVLLLEHDQAGGHGPIGAGRARRRAASSRPASSAR